MWYYLVKCDVVGKVTELQLWGLSWEKYCKVGDAWNPLKTDTSTGPYCLMSDFWKEPWFIIDDVPRKTTTTSCRLLLWSQLSCEQHFSVVARELQCVKAVGHLQNLDWLRSTRGSCDFQRAGDVLMHNDAGVGWWGRSTGTPFPLYVRNLCDWHKLSLFVLPFFTFFFFVNEPWHSLWRIYIDQIRWR